MVGWSTHAAFVWRWTYAQLVYSAGRYVAHWLGAAATFEHAKLVQDDIPNDINQWVQPAGALGRMRRVFDPLPMRNTWQHTLYLDLDHELWEGTHFLHRFKWDALWQRDDKEAVA